MKKIRQYAPKRGATGRLFDGRKAINDLYDSKWAAHSKKFLEINRFCYSCGKPSEVTDHLVPHKGNKALFWKADNMIPLCISCHNIVTNKFDRFYRAGNNIQAKILWLHSNRMRFMLIDRVKVVPVSPDEGVS